MLHRIFFWITGALIEEARILFWRSVLWVCFITLTCAGIVGVMAVYLVFGLPATVVLIAALYALCVWLEGRTSYLGSGGHWLGDNGKPALPGPGIRALPPQGARQIARLSRALTTRPALPDRSRK
jgi:hypothetical protein